MLYVYAFAEAPAAVPSVHGIGDALVEAERVDGLDAIVSRHEAPIDPSEPAIVAHAAVVEAVAAANRAVLPARFGGIHADGEALRAAVAPRIAALEEALARVRGCVELGVRALAPSAQPVAASSGAAYMHGRLAQQRETGRLADELHAPLADLARDATRTVGATERLLLSGSYLLPEDAVATFRERVASLEQAHPELAIVCTGPWPPYSFATTEAGS
jgi:hypothetical protein